QLLFMSVLPAQADIKLLRACERGNPGGREKERTARRGLLKALLGHEETRRAVARTPRPALGAVAIHRLPPTGRGRLNPRYTYVDCVVSLDERRLPPIQWQT